MYGLGLAEMALHEVCVFSFSHMGSSVSLQWHVQGRGRGRNAAPVAAQG